MSVVLEVFCLLAAAAVVCLIGLECIVVLCRAVAYLAGYNSHSYITKEGQWRVKYTKR